MSYFNNNNNDQEYYEVIGRGGSVRHTGYFSSDNPYLNQMMSAKRNQDKDALYELAIKWEADNANTQEGREYNSPVEEVERQREAGINPDLSSSGGSGGSGASGSGAYIPQQQAQTKFSNAYDNYDRVILGINTAVNVATSVASLPGAIAQGALALGTLPSNLALAKNQKALSDVAVEQAGIEKDLSQNELAVSNRTLNSRVAQIQAQSFLAQNQLDLQTIQKYQSLVPLIGPDVPDVEALQMLELLGMGEDDLAAVRILQKNPEFSKNIASFQKQLRQDQTWLQTYTPEVLSQLYNHQASIDNLDKLSGVAMANLQKNIAEGLNTQENADNIVNAQLGANKQQLEFVKRDLDVFEFSVKQIADEVKTLDKMYKEAQKKFEADGILYDTERAVLNSYTTRKMELMSLGHQRVSEFVNIVRDGYYQQFMNNQLFEIGPDGTAGPGKNFKANLGQYVNNFAQVTFGKLVDGSTSWTQFNQIKQGYLNYYETKRNNLYNNQIGTANAGANLINAIIPF